MNKTNNKKSKVDKCPSTFPQDKDVSKKCIFNEKPQEKIEHKNGMVNGIDNDSSSVQKSSRRNRRSKHKNSDIIEESLTDKSSESKCISDINCIGKTAPQIDNRIEDQSSKEKETSDSDNIVNNVAKQIKGSKKRKCKLGKLDSNDNISTNLSCDNQLQISTKPDTITENPELKTVLQDEAVPSCSNLSTPNTKIESKVDESILEVANSLRNVQLDDHEKAESPIKPKIDFIQYESELQMPMIMKIIQKDLSEPYSIYTYRYFIHNWPKLCFLAMCEGECVGAIVCKLDLHRKVIKRGYIAMLAVDQNYRKLRIGSNLVQMAINEMLMGDADEVVLETEVTNKPALQLYEKLGFVRDKRLFRYYLNGVDALRLKLWLR